MALVLGIAVSAGCQKPALRDKPPPDPLLTSKKPIEATALLHEARPVEAEEFAPPPRPVVEDDVRPVRMLGLRPAGQGQR
jgi:hypothetical protein